MVILLFDEGGLMVHYFFLRLKCNLAMYTECINMKNLSILVINEVAS